MRRRIKLGMNIILLLIGIAVLAVLPKVLPRYQVLLLTEVMIYAIVALALNFLLNYGGMVSFGHAGFFGAGAYAVALLQKYAMINEFWVLLLAAIAFAAAYAALVGFVCTRAYGLYLSLLTLGFAHLLYVLMYKLWLWTGGSDGLPVEIPTILGYGFAGISRAIFIRDYLYYLVLAFLIACILFLWVVVRSPYGKIFEAIRDDEVRARFIGISVDLHKWLAFVISGALSGISGALFAFLNGRITPDLTLHWSLSMEIVFMALLGGFQSFLGPIVGALAFTYLKTYAIAVTIYWELLTGILLAVIVLAFPRGIMGYLSRVRELSVFRRSGGGGRSGSSKV